jgi:hypothetical protein
MKVDTDAGLVDTLTIQIILSSASLRRLMITYSALMEVSSRKELVCSLVCLVIHWEQINGRKTFY